MSATAPNRTTARLTPLVVALALLSALTACAPRMAVLSGTEYTGSLPNTALSGHRMLNFRWEYKDGRINTKGLGRFSIAAPDSLRLDVELQGGQLSSFAILLGAGPFRTPMDEETIRMFPTPELIWAAVGRLAVPASGDTIKRVQDGVVRADIGSDPKWRATFDGSRLVSMEKAVKGKRVERVTRAQDGAVTYVRGNSILKLTEVKDSIVAAFSSGIWRY